MAIRFSCPACGKPLSVDEGYAGATAPCPKCQTVITAPSAIGEQAVLAAPGLPTEPSIMPMPPATAPQAIKECPGCGAASPTQASFCASCGEALVPGLPRREIIRRQAVDDSGYIYVLVNASMEGLVKIGKTTRDPAERAKELSAATGVPSPFVVAYEAFFTQCSAAEQYIHALLEQQGYRVAKNKEFFAAPSRVAIQAVIEAEAALDPAIETADGLGDNELDASDGGEDALPWMHVLQEALEHHYGSADTLQDHGEAGRLYQQAARLGSAMACLQLGSMHANGELGREDDQQALQWFKEGARRGSGDCYAEMALVYMRQEHADNARKCWDRYIESSDFWETAESRGRYGWWYCSSAKAHGLPIAHRDALARVKDEILAYGARLQVGETDREWRNTLAANKRYIAWVLGSVPLSSRREGHVVTATPEGDVATVAFGLLSGCTLSSAEVIEGPRRLRTGQRVLCEVANSDHGPWAYNASVFGR